MGLGIASMVGQATGGIFLAKMQYDESRARAAIANRNAAMARAAARDAYSRGDAEAQLKRRKLSMLVGEQRAAVGASGIDVGSGSVADVIADTKAMGELEVLTVQNNATREAWGYASQADAYSFQARMAEHTGELQAVATLVSAGAATAQTGHTMEVFG